jgi:cephalosporin hydroxylase
MENNTVIGHTSYKGLTAQQHPNFYPILKNFLFEVKPSQVLEIGTAGGGFTLAIRDILNEIGLESSSIKSFEVIDQPQYEELRTKNIEVNIENIFDHSYFNLEKPEKIVPYIQNKGVTVVFCDGGHKKGEFSMIAPYLKTGDYILAHDYINTSENFKNNFEGKIWNWREVGEEDLIKTSQKENLVPYYQEEFSKIVWACKQKQ